MSNIKPFTFNFNGKNSETDFGIRANSYDFLMPEKRERKQFIPFRHGKYDYGAQWFNERQLVIRCIWISSALKKITRSDVREIAYWLSQKGKIEFDIEPDKYYIGEVYNSNELISHYNYASVNMDANENIDTTDGEFELTFVCEPFAYRNVITQPLTQGINRMSYEGTAETPTQIIIRNPNSYPMSNIQVTAVKIKK